MAKVKKINVLAYAKVQAIMAALAGLLTGIIYAFGGLIMDILVSAGWITSSETPGLSFGTVLAFLAIPVMPIYFWVIGLATGIVGAILYNKTSKWFGGIDMNFKQKA
jgi:hypothetical protein